MGFRWLLSAVVVAFVGAATVLDLVGSSHTNLWPVTALTLAFFVAVVVSRLLYMRAHPSNEDSDR